MLSITTNFEFVKLFFGHLRENAVGDGCQRFAQERAAAGSHFVNDHTERENIVEAINKKIQMEVGGGGLTFSTVVTLLVLPAIYVLMATPVDNLRN